ncbi:histidine kinase [Nocardiopsis sediminis]|uniref:Histidine kinase n=1 Tax=Nocardiopsis sediminis TaxID=1778267 RepID=A0ABV8FVP0_9ACTN
MKRRWDTARGGLYDLAALAVRLGVGWLFTEHAWRILRGGAPAPPAAGPVTPEVWACAEAAGAAAFALGFFGPAAGALLAFMALGGAGPAAADAPAALTGGSPALLAVVVAACLAAAVRPGRLALDRVVPHRRPAARGERARIRVPERADTSPRRPEEAPPLPYPEGRAAFERPSHT